MSPQLLTLLGEAARIIMFGVIALMVAAGAVHTFQPAFIKNRERVARILFQTGVGGLFYCFAVLALLFINHQFQFEYVARHSRLDHEFQFLISGVWSGQEGSFLLWAVASAIFGLVAIRFARHYERWFTVVYALFLGSLAAILSYESPFTRFPNGAIPIDGNGMSPTLMNYWMVIHPPTIFLGFGSLTVLFAWSIAAMLQKDLDEWVKMARPWALVGLSLLGLGLCMGGFWAYETLGWGGFWAWDPVENTSFVPWITLAAFVHGVFVQLARGKWKVVNAVLGALPFVLFCYGTFLTRSGFLGDTSVHSFAQMDSNALWLLIGLGSIALLALIVISIWSAKQQPKDDSINPAETWFNRENLYGTGMWLISIFGLFVAIGMSLPFLTGTILNRQMQVVEERLYHQVLAWPFPFIVLLIAITPFVTWRGITGKEVINKLINTLAVSVGLIGFALLWVKWAGSEIVLGNYILGIPGFAADPTKTIHFFGDVNVRATEWVLFLTWLCLFAALANINRGIFQMRKSKTSFGGHLTHVGLTLALLGLIFSRGFEQKEELMVHPTIPPERRMAFGYEVDIKGRTDEYTNRKNTIEFAVSNGKESFTANPGLYFVMGQDGPQPIQSPYILSRPLYDLYIVAHQFSFLGSEPTPLLPNENGRFNNILVTFNQMRMEGEAGMAGTTFYADLTVQTPEGTKRVSPYFRITDQAGQFERPDIPVTEHIALSLDRIDPATGEVYIVATYLTEMFPVDVYYKPLTVFVWWGVGIMTLGGLLSAYSRRYRPQKPSDSQTPAEEPMAPPAEQTEDAPEQLTQV